MFRFAAVMCTICLGVSAFLTLVAVAQEGGRRDGDQERDGEESAREYTLTRVEDMRGRGNNGPEAGVQAPDFSLTPLQFYEFGIDKTEITEKNAGVLYESVTLSDFRGKKPVVLIFGSYT